jgi:hypothetical protein
MLKNMAGFLSVKACASIAKKKVNKKYARIVESDTPQ